MRTLCEESAGKTHVLQGNIAFAAGCVRAGIHSVEGYPGTPSTEVIDKGLSAVQDKIKVGWSVNEAVAAGMGVGASFAGADCVVTMKIPGLFQAGDIFTSISSYTAPRGALVFYIASDFVPNSTQHIVDPRYLYKSCFVPVFEPRNHQEMHEAAEIAANISNEYHCPVVVHASGLLCHSEGLIRLMQIKERPFQKVAPLNQLNSLPVKARMAYDSMMDTRVPILQKMVEESPMNHEYKGVGKKGVITYGSGVMYVSDYKEKIDQDIDILSLAFTNPLPLERIRAFAEPILKNGGEVIVIEDGYRYVQESCLAAGILVSGKPYDSKITEWTAQGIAEFLGKPCACQDKDNCASTQEETSKSLDIIPKIAPIPRPPMICAGCPYRLTGEVLSRMRRTGKLETIFGDIGCNTLLYFMNALDTGLAMGASESCRAGYVNMLPEKAARCISLLGDGTECHSGMDSTRNTIFRRIPGLKIVLDNEWIAMTGGQPGAASPVNLAGQSNSFSLLDSIKGEGAQMLTADAYNYKELQEKIKEGLALASQGDTLVVLIIRGTCIRRVPVEEKKPRPELNPDLCISCSSCMICPGIEMDAKKKPRWNNLCTACASGVSSCMQLCPKNAISVNIPKEKMKNGVTLPEAPDQIEMPVLSKEMRPENLAISIRGVGGQGNLFFGKVLAQVAFLAGYEDTNILKGEIHGMAQMGGPVVSSFSCGNVYCPELAPKTATCLIAMEMSEILRPGFLELLSPQGTIILADTMILPQGMKASKYPNLTEIEESLKAYNVIKINVLDSAIKLGDPMGRCANVVMLGLLSTLKPFNEIPESIWLNAIKKVTSKKELWNLNYAAFLEGKKLG